MSSKLPEKKEELPDNCVLVIEDFAENNTFVVQDEFSHSMGGNNTALYIL